MSNTDLSSEERIKLIEDNLAKPKEIEQKTRYCPFCSPRKDKQDLKYFDSLYQDVFCHAYLRIENKSIQIGLDPDNCPHDEFLLDTAWPTICFIKHTIEKIKSLRDWDGVHLSDIDPNFPEDIIQILADQDKMEFVLLWHEQCEKQETTQLYSEYANNKPDPALYELYSGLIKQKSVTGIPARDAILEYKPDLTVEQIDDLVGYARFRESYDNIGIFAENAITLIKNIDEIYLKSLDPYQYYCPNRERGKHYASYQQWQHNKHHLVKNHRVFRNWLDETEAKLGRKMQDWSFLFDSGV